MPGGRYFANIRAPIEKRQISNCFAIEIEDDRRDWAKKLGDIALLTLYGGGVGFDVSPLRPYAAEISTTPGQIAGGPCSFIRAADSMVEALKSCRRGALLAQLNWKHPDIEQFIDLKKGDGKLQRTNISVQFDEEWHDIIDGYLAGKNDGGKALQIFKMVLFSAVVFGEPGMLFNGRQYKPFGKYANPCAELRTNHSYDSCNIGGLHLNHIFPDYLAVKGMSYKTIEDILYPHVNNCVKMLLLGGKASMLAVPECEAVRSKANRILLGASDLFPFYHAAGAVAYTTMLHALEHLTQYMAKKYSNELGLPEPEACLGIAPNGTMQLIAENCGGIGEPYAEAMVRKIMQQDGSMRPKYEVKIDPGFQRLRNMGVHCPTSQSITLAEAIEFQALTQDFFDMGISKTCNLPARGEPGNDMSIDDMTAIILPQHRRLAGLTFYPNAAIEGQPLTAITLEQAEEFLKGSDSVLLEDTESLLAISNIVCKGGACGA
jgi:ribonucleotide reductase alpha subunit